jgi:hypothetical protein
MNSVKKLSEFGNRALKSVRHHLRERLQADEFPGRALEVFPADTFIVSYPRSGNTWVRFLVASVLHPEIPTDFRNVDVRVPSIYKVTADYLAALARPRVLKSHEYFDPRYPRVIYIVRDPRDVLVSYYHYSMLSAFADRLMSGQVNAFGTWQENVSSWLATRGDQQDFLLVRYEDLKREGVTELGRIAGFLGCNTNRSELVRIVAECSFEKMREAETKTDEESAYMRRVRSDIGFVRKGDTGSWRTELPAAVNARLEAKWRPMMERLGYDY